MKKLFWTILTAFTFLGTPGMAETGKDLIILDVRTPEEYKETRVIGSQNIDFKNPEFKSQLEKLDKTKHYKIYCRSGNRSGKTMEMMKNMGFKDLENLGGVKEASQKMKVACEGEKPC